MEPKPKTVLIVEDEADFRKASALALSTLGLRVLQSDGVAVGFHLFQQEEPSLVILDINLPDGTGVDLCKKIRAHKTLAKTPVIMLTARGQLEHKEEGFGAGADQYLVKPVATKELMMWVQALLQRLAFDADEGGEVVVGDLTIHTDAHLVRWKDVTISNLTVKEFELLYSLVKKRPKVLTRQFILSKLWRTVALDSVVDSHMSNLRRKLPPELADKLQTVPGKGFRFFD
ncbi:MAG: response regulator transcription factor [Elusimicrobia bacterium]|nr:response regulator transcription factor [Elusimicrobiota bacterium]